MNPELMEAFTFYTKDPRWKVKLGILIAALFTIIGWVPGAGYCIRLYRNVLEDKPEDRILPEWEDFGDFLFKGISIIAGFIGYVAAFAIVGGLIVFVSGLPKLLLRGEGSAFSAIFAYVGAFVFIFAALVVLGSVFAGFSQTLEIGSCYAFSDVIQRIAGLGKDYFLFSLLLDFCFLASFKLLTTVLPDILFYLAICVVWGMLFIIFTYGLGVMMEDAFHPILTDPTNIHIERREYFDDTDEYGNTKQGAHKASSLADRRPDTSLTWSTDSDEAES